MELLLLHPLNDIMTCFYIRHWLWQREEVNYIVTMVSIRLVLQSQRYGLLRYTDADKLGDFGVNEGRTLKQKRAKVRGAFFKSFGLQWIGECLGCF